MKTPLKKLSSELERTLLRVWGGLSEGWRELSSSNGALTHFVRAAGGKDAQPGMPHWSLLASEVWETSRAIIIKVEMPGVAKDQIQASIERGRLRIRGEKRSGGEQEKRRYHVRERAFGRFEREIALPHNVDATNAEVSYQDGVVTVILGKTQATPPTHLAVK